MSVERPDEKAAKFRLSCDMTRKIKRVYVRYRPEKI